MEGQGNSSASESRYFEELGGEVTVTKLPGMKAQLLWVRIARAIGPALGAAAGGIKADDVPELVAGNLAGAGKGLGDLTRILAERMTVEEFDAIRMELLRSTHFGGGPILKQADVLFQGKTVALFKVIGFALKVNYADFFGVALAGVARLGTPRARPSGTSPTTSPQPGPVGD